jgi:2-oxoisovalerate dehydrogenase E1 component
MQFADFVTSGFTQIVNNLAKDPLPVGTGSRCSYQDADRRGLGAGPFHSQSNEAWFTHTPV